MTSWQEAAPTLGLTVFAIVMLVVTAVVVILIVGFARNELDEARARRDELEERAAVRSWASWLTSRHTEISARHEAWARSKMRKAIEARDADDQ